MMKKDYTIRTANASIAQSRFIEAIDRLASYTALDEAINTNMFLIRKELNEYRHASFSLLSIHQRASFK